MSTQRIGRLMPLQDVLAQVAALARPVGATQIDIAAALHRVAADDVTVPQPRPATPVALRDGYAVEADATADASSYAPVPLAGARAVDVGAPLPAGSDAVVPHEAVTAQAAGVQALAPVGRGEGVLAVAADADPEQPIALAGRLLRGADLAALAAAGIAQVMVRVPQVRIVTAHDDPVLDAIATLVARLVTSSGGAVLAGKRDVDAALREAAAQLTIIVGGSGSGTRDTSVTALARAGKVIAHGIGISPGETAALGSVGARPVLVVPGRLDAARALWVVLAAAIMTALTGRTQATPGVAATLTRKITSTLGMVEVVPVRLQQAQATPLASGYWPLQVQAITDGYVVVPAESEGFAEGAAVAVRMVV